MEVRTANPDLVFYLFIFGFLLDFYF